MSRPLEVTYQLSTKTHVSVRQTAYSWDQFARLYPKFQPIGSRVIDKHKQILMNLNQKWRWQAVKVGLKLVGLQRHSIDLQRKMPGELAAISFVMGNEELITPILTSLIEGKGKAGKGYDQFTTVNMTTEKLRSDMPTLIAKALQASSNSDDLQADVLFFHTHPGSAAPLSPNDEKVLESAQRRFSQEFPFISFRFVMAAAAKLNTQGDLIFVKELKSPATAKLKDLLEKYR